MTCLPLIIAPNPIFKQISEEVIVDDDIRLLMDDLLDTIYSKKGRGIAAPMVGILKRVIIIDLQENNTKEPYFMANPKITFFSSETQTFEEGSLCFPGIVAEIDRPESIMLDYIDYNNEAQTLEASGFLATCIQHEIDYLNGRIFLDYLSPLKRDILLRKYKKAKAGFHHHIHDENCNH